MPRKMNPGARSSRSRKESRPSIFTFDDAVRAAGPRPPDGAKAPEKKNYAEKLSRTLAILLANHFRENSEVLRRDILPSPDGYGAESRSAAGSSNKGKKTDVRYATPMTGLELVVSIKTLNYLDPTAGRFTKNMKRADHEFRAEVIDLHERFPFSVLAALYFIPIEACDDGRREGSSFAHSIETFRPRVGRLGPSGPTSLFELFFVGLYSRNPDGTSTVGFFDVRAKPPRRGRPPWPSDALAPADYDGGYLLTLEEVVSEIARVHGLRNGTLIEWAADTVKLPPGPMTVIHSNEPDPYGSEITSSDDEDDDD